MYSKPPYDIRQFSIHTDNPKDKTLKIRGSAITTSLAGMKALLLIMEEP